MDSEAIIKLFKSYIEDNECEFEIDKNALKKPPKKEASSKINYPKIGTTFASSIIITHFYLISSFIHLIITETI